MWPSLQLLTSMLMSQPPAIAVPLDQAKLVLTIPQSSLVDQVRRISRQLVKLWMVSRETTLVRREGRRQNAKFLLAIIDGCYS